MLLLLLPPEAAGDPQSDVDLRVHRAEAAWKDREVHSHLQSQCGVETWKARYLRRLRGCSFHVFVTNKPSYKSMSLVDRGSKGRMRGSMDSESESIGASSSASKSIGAAVSSFAFSISAPNYTSSLKQETTSSSCCLSGTNAFDEEASQVSIGYTITLKFKKQTSVPSSNCSFSDRRDCEGSAVSVDERAGTLCIMKGLRTN